MRIPVFSTQDEMNVWAQGMVEMHRRELVRAAVAYDEAKFKGVGRAEFLRWNNLPETAEEA